MSSLSLIVFLFSSLSFIFFCFLDNGFAGADEIAGGRHLISVASLIPATTCSSSMPKVADDRKSSSAKVVHRNGPCSKLTNNDKATVNEFLIQDESRVKSIHSRAKINSASKTNTPLQDTDSISIPAKSGFSLGTRNFIVTVGLGTPKRDLSLIFDTGSDLIWTQCQPCEGTCYSQQEPIFDPSLSKSYKNVPCSSPQCSALISATGKQPRCLSSTNTCTYGIQYGDRSLSVGYLATETLTLSPTDIFPNLYFGCGENNQGLFNGAAGLIGLGRDPLSLVSQTAGKYGKYFSYCLPSSSSTGHLTFGKGKSNFANAKFTSLSSNSQLPSFYFIDIIGIKVGMKISPIPRSVFTNSGGTVIDSGTVITRLPPTAYTALKTEFRKQMSDYNLTNPRTLLDTCYDFSSYKSILVPKISFLFAGNVELSVPPNGIFFQASTAQVCLGFAGNTDDTSLGIFGNVQQQTLEVIYDVAGGKLGFAAGGCS
ncbi:aspartyl protease family protein At5g10770-like [Impatiens glandulifera]|uniref:aspartyl protease family protein At5g10770-like n=1 Tax=Impatiens glandulifera TaxID=253017 RepID=UPI001FB0C463|nr:aspartyl protease family protein At5g10770-like [Impatiens glandulifera]